uniref:Uncharacterized protein n=1 Tax=Arundo donax TaxID=35708 RepID=A0A0A9GVD2_ARUDO
MITQVLQFNIDSCCILAAMGEEEIQFEKLNKIPASNVNLKGVTEDCALEMYASSGRSCWISLCVEFVRQFCNSTAF